MVLKAHNGIFDGVATAHTLEECPWLDAAQSGRPA